MANPMIRKWEIMSAKDWNDGAKEMISTIADFISEADESSYMNITDPIFLVGNVYGRTGFNDGDKISTSNIVRIERLPAPTTFGELLEYGNCGKRFVATTKTGSCYEFVELGIDGMSASQCMLSRRNRCRTSIDLF